MRGLKNCALLAQIGPGTKAKPSYSGRSKITEDVTKEVLAHEHIKPLRPQHERLSGGIGIEGVFVDVRVRFAHFLEHLAEQDEAAQHIALIYARHPFDAILWCARALAGQLKGKTCNAFRAAAGDRDGVFHPFGCHLSLSTGKIHALRVLPYDHVIDVAGSFPSKSRGHPWKEKDRPDVSVQVEPLAQHPAENAGLGAIRVTYLRQPHRPLQDGIRRLARSERLRREVHTSLSVVCRPGWIEMEVETKASFVPLYCLKDLERSVYHLGANPIPFEDNDGVGLHSRAPSLDLFLCPVKRLRGALQTLIWKGLSTPAHSPVACCAVPDGPHPDPLPHGGRGCKMSCIQRVASDEQHVILSTP